MLRSKSAALGGAACSSRWLLASLLVLGLQACMSVPQQSVSPDRVRTLAGDGFRGGLAHSGELYLAGVPDAAGLDRLPGLGVRTVIDLRTNEELDAAELDESKQLERLGIAWRSLPAGGESAPFSPEHVAAFDALLAQSDGPILLHCGSGYRATHLYVAWLHRARGMSLPEALAVGQALRLGSLPLEGFLGAPLHVLVVDH